MSTKTIEPTKKILSDKKIFIIPRANVVSGMVENLRRKKFSPARIAVGGCRLSVRPSVCPSVRLRYFVE
jgi:hypothetical protein